ncbi:threonine/serine exporter family protein [Bifidobacterium sp. ESL0728]|uniref:threonine/serine exporter family protein n=1 Tax=Bifidobacterium sp. ESL0728 TaxID=2983220 RepID=UPI0023F7B56B|nr:threonine/serine exporter family protein [Bifidobacterium sp. ESL0728]WEV60035.1 threonine/serine exporter family protein [Bifidobacterium sp. ESL0728]
MPLDTADIERDWDTPVVDAGIAAKASIIARVGLLDLRAGTGSFRIHELMHRIGYPLGVHVRANINLTDMDVSCSDGVSRITQVVDLPTTGVNTERIWLLEHFADWFSVNIGEPGTTYHAQPAVSAEMVQQLDNPDAQRSLLSATQKAHRELEKRKRVHEKAVKRAKKRGFRPPKGQYAKHFEHIGKTREDVAAEQAAAAETQAKADAALAQSQVGGQSQGDAAQVQGQVGNQSHVNTAISKSAVRDDKFTVSDGKRGNSGRVFNDSANVSKTKVSDNSAGTDGGNILNGNSASADVGNGENGNVGYVSNINVNAANPPAATKSTNSQSQAKSKASATAKASRGITVRQAHERLSLIQHRKPLYAPWFSGLASAVACACFVFLLGGGPFDMIGAFVGAGIGHWVRRRLFIYHLNQFFVTFVAVAVAAFACIGTLRLIGFFDPVALRHDTAYIGAMLFVIPGFPLITGGLDIAKMDLPSGIQRLVYTMAIILMATLAGWMVAAIVHLNPQGFEPLGLNPWVNTALRALCAFGGVWGFSVLFNSPQRMCFTAAFIGAITDTLRLTIVDMGMPPEAAAFLGAMLAGLLASAWRSSVRHGFLPPYLGYPRICLTVPAIVIMVPGLYMYRAMFYLGQFDTLNALDWAFRAFMVILCLPIGLAMARVITDKSWRYDV